MYPKTSQMNQHHFLEDIVNTYENSIYRFSLVLSQNAIDAEEATREVFRRRFHFTKSFSTQQEERRWFFKVTYEVENHITKHRFFQKREPLLDTFPTKTTQEFELLESIFSLPKPMRTIIHLYYYESFSQEEIATIMNIEEKKVHAFLDKINLRFHISNNIDEQQKGV